MSTNTAKKSKKCANQKGAIQPNNPDYVIYERVKGMCVPLEADLRDTNLSSIRVCNFFPYITKPDGTCGYFFKQPNGTYKNLPRASWRSILHGNISSLRPKNLLPPKNRIEAIDEQTGNTIQICYWPDSYYNFFTNASSKKNKSSTPSEDDNLGASPGKKGPGRKKGSGKTENDILDAVSNNTKPITMLIDVALKGTSYDFLSKEEEEVTKDNDGDDIMTSSNKNILEFDDSFKNVHGSKKTILELFSDQPTKNTKPREEVHFSKKRKQPPLDNTGGSEQIVEPPRKKQKNKSL